MRQGSPRGQQPRFVGDGGPEFVMNEAAWLAIASINRVGVKGNRTSQVAGGLQPGRRSAIVPRWTHRRDQRDGRRCPSRDSTG